MPETPPAPREGDKKSGKERDAEVENASADASTATASLSTSRFRLAKYATRPECCARSAARARAPA